MAIAFEKSADVDAQQFHDLEQARRVSENLPNPASEACDTTREILHELSQPLTAICSFGAVAMNSLNERPTTTTDLQRLRDSLQQMINASNLAAGIITRFRDAKMGCELQTRSRDINELVQNAVDLLDFPIQEKRIRIDYNVIPAIVEVDSVQIQEVLINLIRNSIEAVAADTGRIEITITERHGHVEVFVADNGPGIETSARKNLFQPITSCKQQGMGVGLAVSKSIIQSHGGEIWCSSSTPRGARFHFTLPMPPLTC